MIEGLNLIKRKLPTHVYTASDSVRDGSVRWIHGWRAHGWKTKSGSEVSHRDLGERLAEAQEDHDLSWHVVSRKEDFEPMVRVRELAGEK